MKLRVKRGSRRFHLVAPVALSLCLVAPPALAEVESPEPETPPGRSGELVVPEGRSPTGTPPDLDSLLKLPSGFVGRDAPSVAGVSEAEWRRRFRESREQLQTAREALEATKVELDGAATEGGGSQWSVTPPTGGGGGGGGEGGANPSASPLSFKLRQQLKQNRIDVDEFEKALKELVIEADLARVPVGWRGSDEALDSGPSEVGQVLD